MTGHVLSASVAGVITRGTARRSEGRRAARRRSQSVKGAAAHREGGGGGGGASRVVRGGEGYVTTPDGRRCRPCDLFPFVYRRQIRQINNN